MHLTAAKPAENTDLTTSPMHFHSGGMSTALTSQYSSFLQRLAKVHLYMVDFFKTACFCKLLFVEQKLKNRAEKRQHIPGHK